MSSSTTFDDLPDLILIEIFTYLSSFDTLWGFTHLNQHIISLLIERRYFRCVNLSSAHYFQFNKIIQIIPLNNIESLTIDVNASPLQLSCWPYMPQLSTLRLKGVREYNDIIIFLLLHAATLTHLTIHSRVEFKSGGISLKVCYPLCHLTSLVKNIILRHLHALQSLDLGTNEFNCIRQWPITNISMSLTFLRIVLSNPSDLIRLILTRPLSDTLKHLHITLNDIMSDFDFRLPSKDQLVPMKELQSFILIKSFSWKLKNELILIDLLTNADIMPMLRRINLSITLNINELYCLKQCSIFNDYRCIDVHFVLYIDVFDPTFQLKDLIPHGSLSYPRKIMGSMLMFNYWYDIGYSTTVRLNRWSRYKFDRRWVWYTLPWSFQSFFHMPIQNQCNHNRELYASPSSSNIIIPPNISTLNEQANILPLPQFYFIPSLILQHNNQSYYHDIDTTIRLTIPADRIIVIDCLERISDFTYTGNLRSINIILNFSQTFTTINWKLLRIFSFLPLLKSFRITIHNFESILEDEHCQLIAERVPKLTDFVYCFRRDSGPIDDDNDQFNIHQKSILNLYHHISRLIRDQQHKILIETDGCGLMMWL